MSTIATYQNNILNWNTKEFPNNEYSFAAKKQFKSHAEARELHKPINHMNNPSPEYNDMVKLTADFTYNKMLKDIDSDNILKTLKESIRKENEKDQRGGDEKGGGDDKGDEGEHDVENSTDYMDVYNTIKSKLQLEGKDIESLSKEQRGKMIRAHRNNVINKGKAGEKKKHNKKLSKKRIAEMIRIHKVNTLHGNTFTINDLSHLPEKYVGMVKTDNETLTAINLYNHLLDVKEYFMRFQDKYKELF